VEEALILARLDSLFTKHQAAGSTEAQMQLLELGPSLPVQHQTMVLLPSINVQEKESQAEEHPTLKPVNNQQQQMLTNSLLITQQNPVA